jgi:hypothetical protein
VTTGAGNRVGRVALPVVVGSIAAFAGAGGVLGVTGAVVAASLVGAYGGLDRRTPAARWAAEAAEAEAGRRAAFQSITSPTEAGR